MQATTANQYERLTVHVPRAEAKRFKAIVKALGFEIEKTKCAHALPQYHRAHDR